MLERPSRRSTSGTTAQSRTSGERPDARSDGSSTVFRLGRLIYGGILAMMAIDGLRNAEERAQYAEAKGVPKPKRANNFAHGMLLVGGIGISLWRFPRLAASAAAAFFLGVTPAIHDFWTVDDADQKQQETTHFLKNAALFGTALALLGVANGEQ